MTPCCVVLVTFILFRENNIGDIDKNFLKSSPNVYISKSIFEQLFRTLDLKRHDNQEYEALTLRQHILDKSPARTDESKCH